MDPAAGSGARIAPLLMRSICHVPTTLRPGGPPSIDRSRAAAMRGAEAVVVHRAFFATG